MIVFQQDMVCGGTPSYGEIVAEQLGANYTNLAVNGSTTSDLLKSLNEDETVIDTVTEAGVILHLNWR